jgi:hypothetical protein
MFRFSVVSIQFSFMCSTWHIGLYAVATKPRPHVFCVATKLLMNSPSSCCCCMAPPKSDCFQALEVYVTCWYVLFSLSIYYFVSCGTFVHVLALALSLCATSLFQKTGWAWVHRVQDFSGVATFGEGSSNSLFSRCLLSFSFVLYWASCLVDYWNIFVAFFFATMSLKRDSGDDLLLWLKV